VTYLKVISQNLLEILKKTTNTAVMIAGLPVKFQLDILQTHPYTRLFGKKKKKLMLNL